MNIPNAAMEIEACAQNAGQPTLGLVERPRKAHTKAATTAAKNNPESAAFDQKDLKCGGGTLIPILQSARVVKGRYLERGIPVVLRIRSASLLLSSKLATDTSFGEWALFIKYG